MEDELYYCYSASLRIYGDIHDLNEISKIVGVKPTHTHLKGDKRTETSKPRPSDMWLYEPNIHETEKLSKHLNALWAAIGENAEGIKRLKKNLTVNVFCGYRSNCDHAGFDVDYNSLTIFKELEVPFDVSVMLLPEE